MAQLNLRGAGRAWRLVPGVSQPPTADDDGAPIATVLAKVPPTGLAARRADRAAHVPRWQRHHAEGVRRRRRVVRWSGRVRGVQGAGQPRPEDLERAATVSVAEVRRSARGLELDVLVENKSGHKFPTGYPSRRAWLHVKVSGPSGVVFESGRSDEYGRIVDRGGQVLDAPAAFFPHRDAITDERQVAVYEAVLGDEAGKVVHRPLEATRYLKDNRLQPLGYSTARPTRRESQSPTDPSAIRTRAARITASSSSGRASWRRGGAHDRGRAVSSWRPADLEMLAERPTPTARKLFDLVAGKLAPTVVARATRAAP